MLKNLLFLLGLLLLLTLSVFAEPKYAGSFKAGSSISGYGDNDYSVINYDFVVEKYGLVEFVPADLYEENEHRGAIQYKIQDLAEEHTQGYFYLGGASGITYRGSLDYPNGWKIHMFPGIYRVKVYSGGSNNRYSMSTIFTPASNQLPKTGESLAMNIEDAVSINTNTLYNDNIGYYSSIRDSTKAIQNSRDFFKFTLSEDSDFEIQATIDSTFTSNLDSTKIRFYIWDRITNFSYSDYLIYYKDTSKNSSKIFHRGAGDYYISVGGTHSGNYSFKIATTSDQTQTESFVARLFSNIMGRTYDQGGMDYWSGELDGGKTAFQVAKFFFQSDEFKGLNLSNEEFISRLYTTLMDREQDEEGAAYWKSQIENKGWSQYLVFYKFAISPEFATVCENYGTTNLNADDKIEGFVESMYTLVLNRASDPQGFGEWTSFLKDGSKTASDIVTGFFNSEEFISRNLSNMEFVEVAYRAILGREADTAGKDTWSGLITSGNMTRTQVLSAFLESDEFTNLAAEYGITAK